MRSQALGKQTAYYRRLGQLIRSAPEESEMRMSRAMQICRTWRSHLAWRLAEALVSLKERSR
jgi:hypothetical protein